MKSKSILGAVMALALMGSTAAIADNDHWRHHHRHGNDRSEWVHERNEARREARRDAYREARREAWREERARQRWVRGHSWPSEYRYNKYIVSDWEARRLRRAPVGYRWYRADDEYVLVRQKDNVISDIVSALVQ
ncbi:MAG TPA: RcnB family protein [Patescibacteria group bacterium]|nr:RcnB family protein [Patescibacteria group bacterium]